MPNENPPPQSISAEIETVLHALSLYGAAGIAAFGCAGSSAWRPPAVAYEAERFA